MTRILITGASGLLGLNLALQAQAEGYEVVGWANDSFVQHAPFTIHQVNLLEMDKIASRVAAVNPDLVIHCAALASLEGSEADPDLASMLNGEVPGVIALGAQQNDIKMIHISTDAVFDGIKGGYTEEDPPSPLNQYAQTKLAGEYAVQKAYPQAIVARVNFYGWSLSGKRSLAEFFYTNLSASSPVNGFSDVFFCPLFTEQLGATLFEMAQSGLKGLYHVLSSESLSKYEFGIRLAQLFGFDCELISPISIKDAGLKAVRSPNMTLSVAKIEHDLGHAMPGQGECLESLYQSFNAGLPGKIQACR